MKIGMQTLLLGLITSLGMADIYAAAKDFPKFSAGPTYASNRLDDTEAPKLQLCGEATLKAYKIFAVGQSALYRQDCQAPWELKASEPKLMYFRYARDIPGHAFAESAMSMLDRNIQLTESQRSALNKFHQLYRDVSIGDTYAMSYGQQQGLLLFLNGELLGKLQLQPLAHEYFSIWLGVKPFNEKLKANLLGQ